MIIKDNTKKKIVSATVIQQFIINAYKQHELICNENGKRRRLHKKKYINDKIIQEKWLNHPKMTEKWTSKQKIVQ